MKGTAGYNRLLHSGFSILQLPEIDEFAAIHIIAYDWMFYMREMDAYLVCSAGFGG